MFKFNPRKNIAMIMANTPGLAMPGYTEGTADMVGTLLGNQLNIVNRYQELTVLQSFATMMATGNHDAAASGTNPQALMIYKMLTLMPTGREYLRLMLAEKGMAVGDSSVAAGAISDAVLTELNRDSASTAAFSVTDSTVRGYFPKGLKVGDQINIKLMQTLTLTGSGDLPTLSTNRLYTVTAVTVNKGTGAYDALSLTPKTGGKKATKLVDGTTINGDGLIGRVAVSAAGEVTVVTGKTAVFNVDDDLIVKVAGKYYSRKLTAADIDSAKALETTVTGPVVNSGVVTLNGWTEVTTSGNTFNVKMQVSSGHGFDYNSQAATDKFGEVYTGSTTNVNNFIKGTASGKSFASVVKEFKAIIPVIKAMLNGNAKVEQLASMKEFITAKLEPATSISTQMIKLFTKIIDTLMGMLR